MNMMNDLQCAYLLGRNSDIPLGGVGCHAYFEFNCKAVNREKLAAAWKRCSCFMKNCIQDTAVVR